jgi:hypothetical protein
MREVMPTIGFDALANVKKKLERFRRLMEKETTSRRVRFRISKYYKSLYAVI